MSFYYFFFGLSPFFSRSACDFAQPWQLGFQDPATPIAEGIVDLHNDIMFFLCVVCIFVLYILMRTVFLFHSSKDNFVKIVHGKVIEIVWTLTPSFILAIIAIPSLALLYSMDEVLDPAITIKAIGHQWYWSYEYSDYNSVLTDPTSAISFDSYMVSVDDLSPGQLRLLEVDNPIFLPVSTHVRLLITSEDVLHSWALPSFGVKVDACPGRLNQTSLFIKRPGTYYGQCSEICGVNHAFMPICVKAVPLDDYISWVSSQLSSFFSFSILLSFYLYFVPFSCLVLGGYAPLLSRYSHFNPHFSPTPLGWDGDGYVKCSESLLAEHFKGGTSALRA